MSERSPLRIHTAVVQPEWIDYNGHVNDGYYVVGFTKATDAVQDLVGLDQEYREASGCSIYTVEAHVTYQREVPPDTPLAYETWVLGVDADRPVSSDPSPNRIRQHARSAAVATRFPNQIPGGRELADVSALEL